MTTLYDSARRVKNRPFGRGVLAFVAIHHQTGYTAADRDWAARELNDRDFDREAAEAAALDRLERGLCC